MDEQHAADDGTEIPEHLRAGDEQPRNSMLLSLLRQHSSRRILDIPEGDLGFAEQMPYPFMALVGQVEMRTALLLAVVNPNVGGVLLIGPRGIGKTTAARGLSDLLPYVEQAACDFGCQVDEPRPEGQPGYCEQCGMRLREGNLPPVAMEPVRLIELPLNAQLGDVVGGINERVALERSVVRLDRGILSRADQNILYIDEVNLLPNVIIDAILDAAAQGQYTVRRGAMRATYRSRFILIGSMNPEEGNLRPQILDRFGLRCVVTGLVDPEERRLVYQLVRRYKENRRGFIDAYTEDTFLAREDVIIAREILPDVALSEDALDFGMQLVESLRLHSHRAEFSMFEAARAYAALDAREEATVDDVTLVAPLALRMRQSPFIDSFIDNQAEEDARIQALMEELRGGIDE